MFTAFNGEGDRHMTIETTKITRHARRRAQQRAVSRHQIDLVRQFGDREIKSHNGSRFLMISGKVVQELIDEGFAASDVDKLTRLRLILSRKDNLMTCYWSNRRRKSNPDLHRRARRYQ